MLAQGLAERLRLKGATRRPAAGSRTADPARPGSAESARTTAHTTARTPGGGARATNARGRPGVRKRRLSRRTRRGLLIAVALVVILGGAWMWFRDSPLVSVQQVTVSGQSGADAGQIRSALESAARTMSTLDVQVGRLRRAVAPYPVVKDIRVTTHFPHGMDIEVIENVAVGALDVGGQKIAVAPDGTLMHDVTVSGSLPTIPVSVTPGGARVTSGPAAAAIKLLSAAPGELLPKISQVTTVAPHGLVAQVRGGPSIYFGDATELSQKWIAASEVLGDPGSAGALYIDVTDPQRPAAGAGSDSQSGASSAGTSTDGTGTSGVAPTATAGG